MRKYSKFNRIMSFIMSLSLVSGDIMPALAAGDDAPEGEGNIVSVDEVTLTEDEPDVDAEEEDFVFVPGYVPMPGKEPVSVVADGIDYRQIENGISYTDGEYSVDYAKATDSAYPCSYTQEDELRTFLTTNYPEVRNQNPYGSCWAHSAMGLAEFYAIKHGLADKDVDYSELHLVNYTYHQGTPSIAGDTGDTVRYNPSKDSVNASSSERNILNAGGNLEFAAQTLMRQRGVVLESDAPYSDAANIIPTGTSSLPERKDAVYLRNAMEISFENQDFIKEYIVNNGLVGVSILADDRYYNTANNSFYCNTSNNTNHAVSLVGWDDNFPKNKFNSAAPQNGAWLVRNSWNSPYSDVFSFQEYFWISYYDKSLTDPDINGYEKTAWTYELMPSSEFPGNSYYYDSQIHLNSYLGYQNITYTYSANIYKASAGTDKESLDAVTFAASKIKPEGTEYEISVYTNVDPAKGPTSGTKRSAATTDGTIYLDGYYTVDLKEAVEIEADEYFSVIIRRNDAKTVCYEAEYVYSSDRYMNNGVSFTADAQSRQSFYSPNGSAWNDAAENNCGNFVIGALTSEVSQAGVSLSKTSLSLTSSAPEATLIATVKDEDGKTVNDAVVTWESSDDTVATVDNTGKVSAVADGTAGITAVSGKYKASCTVTVKFSQAAKPVADKTNNSVLSAGDTISLSSTTTGAKIYYTLNGDTPSDSSDLYEGGIVIGKEFAGGSVTLKAVSYADYYKPSAVASYTYTVEGSKEGISLSQTKLTLSSDNLSAKLTASVTDEEGKEDDTAVVTWSVADEDIVTIDKTTGKSITITAVAEGKTTVTAVSGDFEEKCDVTVVFSKAAAPVADKAEGSELAIGEVIRLSCNTKDAEIYYTLNGKTPSKSSAKYSSGIEIGIEHAGKNITLKAIAYADHYKASDVASFEYTVEESKVGVNLSQKKVTLSSNVPAAVIKAKVLKEDNTEDTEAAISWNIADDSVATIDKVSGNSITVTAVANGSTVITATSGEYASVCEVKVELSEAAKPVADKTESKLYVGDLISVSCATVGAKIYYTDDGTDPDEGSNLYAGTIKVTSDMVKKDSNIYKFRAYADHYLPSEILVYEFTAESRAGIVLSAEKLSLTSQNPEATLTAKVYTEEGEEDHTAEVIWSSTDTKVATVSEGVISAVGSGSANIIAKSGSLSADCAVSVEFTKLASPVADKADGSMLKLGSTLKLSCTDSFAEIYYTLDGNEPDKTSLKYTGPIEIGAEYAAKEIVLKTVAIAKNYTDSDVASYNYTVEDKSYIELSEIKVSFTKAGETKDVKATVYDAAGNVSENAAVVWSSSDESVVTVSSGSITAVADGEAVIKAVCGRLSAMCEVKVYLGEREASVPTTIYVVPENIEFEEAGETMQIRVAVEDQYGLVMDDPTVSFESSNKRVATVDDKGLVTAIAAGKTTVTVKSGNAKAKCTVSVAQKEVTIDDFRSAFDTVPDLSQETLYLVVGQKFDLHYPSWNYTCSDKSFSISKKGILKAKKAGSGQIASDDGSIRYDIQIIKPELSNKNLQVKTGETQQLTIKGIDDNYPVAWYSSAPGIATVDDGEIYAISKGSAKIIAVVNGKEYSCKVTVKDTKALKFTSATTEIELSPMQSINTKIKGAWTSDSDMYPVSNGKTTAYTDTIVYITASGKITGIGSGTTVLTAPNGRQFTVSVSDPVEQVQYIASGKKKTLKFASVKNTKAEDWSTGDSQVADVNNKGVVNALSVGETEISCTYNPYGIEGAGFTYSAMVYVENPGIDLPSSKANAYKVDAKQGDRIAIDFYSDDIYGIYQPVIFKSSKPTVAFVDEYGIIRAGDPGSAKLSTKINGKTITIKVNVSGN